MESPPKTVLEARDLIINRNGKLVLQVDHMEVQEGEILALIGPNGAGKSTLLLTLSRLLKSSGGEIVYRGEKLSSSNDLAYRRQIALVLQDPLLLDGTVLKNVMTGLRFRGVSKQAAQAQAEVWIKRLGISHLRDRKSNQLSGGESQRASLARAFAISPDILLLDEPFGRLDSPSRASLLEDFHELLDETNMTTIIVTHDMDEALMLGDRVGVIINGEVRQVGLPEQVFNNPVDLDVAALVGIETVLSGTVIKSSDGHVTVGTCGVEIDVVGKVEIGRDVILFLRPEDVTLWMGTELPVSSARNQLSGTIQKISIQGALMKVIVDCPGCEPDESVRVVSLVTRSSGREMSLSEGTHVTLTFKASAVHLIPR